MENNKQEQEKAKPGLVKVVFDYPFHLGLPDFYYPVKLDNGAELGMIKISSREGMQILDKKRILRNKIENSKTKDPELVNITTSSSKTTDIIGSDEEGRPAFYYKAGEFGKAIYPWHYSKIEVIFPVNNIYAAWSMPENSEYVVNLSNRLFNRLLDSYRHISNDIYNKYLSGVDGDFVQYRAIYISKYSESEKQKPTIEILTQKLLEARSFIPYPMRGNESTAEDFPLVQASIVSPLMMNTRKQTINHEKVLKLLTGRGGLIKGLEIHNKILLTGLERIGFDKDYRMAIVEFDTAVDVCIASYITAMLRSHKKMSESDIDELFDETNQKARSLQNKQKGYLTTMSRITRLEELFNEINGGSSIDVRSSQEFSGWNLLTRKKRNQCVHAWKHFVRKDAEEAFISAQKFIRYIENIGNNLKISL